MTNGDHSEPWAGDILWCFVPYVNICRRNLFTTCRSLFAHLFNCFQQPSTSPFLWFSWMVQLFNMVLVLVLAINIFLCLLWPLIWFWRVWCLLKWFWCLARPGLHSKLVNASEMTLKNLFVVLPYSTHCKAFVATPYWSGWTNTIPRQPRYDR